MDQPTQSLFDDTRSLAIDQLHAATAVYTSTHVVTALLDRLDWPNQTGNLLDPAAGDGSFILTALKRLDPTTLKKSVDRIQGWEIHEGAAVDARYNVASYLQQHGFSQNEARHTATRIIINKDFLTDGPAPKRFRFIAGNPPYLLFRRLPEFFQTIYKTQIPKYAIADILHSFLDACNNLLTPDGSIALICSDRLLFNASATELRRTIGQTLGLSHIARLDPSTSFYRPKRRIRNSPPRVHPVSLVFSPLSTGSFPLDGSPIFPDQIDRTDPAGPTLKDIAKVSIAPWLGPAGIFVISEDMATTLANHGATLIPAVDTDDIDRQTESIRQPTRYAIHTRRQEQPVEAVSRHLLAQLHRMPKRGQNRCHWIPPETINLPLDQPSLLIPRIAKQLRAIRLPAGVLPINHNLTIIQNTQIPLDEVRELLLSAESQAWITRNAARLENQYFSITTTLLRRLPIPAKYKDKAAPKS
jgi:tRNA1(Val) A37 N6-methylase TrmN6